MLCCVVLSAANNVCMCISCRDIWYRHRISEISSTRCLSSTICMIIHYFWWYLLQVNSQNQKLEKIEGNMQKTTEKQTVVNARQRYLLK